MSVSQSVCQSVCNTYLFVRFTSIFYNSKSDQMKLKQYLKDLKLLNLSQHTCTSVLVRFFVKIMYWKISAAIFNYHMVINIVADFFCLLFNENCGNLINSNSLLRWTVILCWKRRLRGSSLPTSGRRSRSARIRSWCW